MSQYARKLEYNWNYRSVPQKNACLHNPNQECNYFRGKGLGGSTIINALIYARGNEMDYNKWNASGIQGWAFKDVLPFFQKLENYRIVGDVGYHGNNGPMFVDHTRHQDLKTLQFLNANKELGRCVGDYNGKNQLCAGQLQYNIINGRRCSTGRAYLRPIWNSRSNLYVSSYSHVTKVLINSITKHAYGVIFAKDNKYFVARSRNEIILSAGIIGSAQLLMLSGVGPKNHLAGLGIPVIHDLPVGKSFGDHVAYSWLYFKTNHSEEEQGLDDMIRDYLNGEGELTKATLTAVVFVQTNFSTIKGYPDIEILFNRYISITNLDFPTNDSSSLFSLSVALLHPNSQGNLKLRSSDPFDYPLINPNFFSDLGNIDMAKLYNGIQLALQLTETDSLKKLGAQLIPVHVPDCQKYEYLSKSYWYCHIRHLSREYLHPYGTCKMGPSPSMGAVVDSKLRVHGIRNLMVADGSVIPSSVSGHTSAMCMMIGERAADMIRRG
ncbi:hypothetical protein RI129_007919 [Pyrocoelia pectoralis]|uniref:Glucose-methanol-choline oxidoreductase N-terminal domain-containing protein n=1 Tax=Pyrocoelia pectoralis TaxID=417401 RepID=A0AAN7VII4_9COLE